MCVKIYKITHDMNILNSGLLYSGFSPDLVQ